MFDIFLFDEKYCKLFYLYKKKGKKVTGNCNEFHKALAVQGKKPFGFTEQSFTK